MPGNDEDRTPSLADVLERVQGGDVEGAVAVLSQADPDKARAILDEIIVQVGPGLPSLHPLYEAALAERLQFDGDIPEARFAPLPPSQDPAVPVDTSARSMVALGTMLEQAAKEVRAELDAARAKALERVEENKGFFKTSDAPAHIVQEEDWAVIKDQSIPPRARVDAPAVQEAIKRHEPEGYKTGAVPTPRRVSGPPGAVLATLTPSERAEAAWKALSTTQGRRSAIGGLVDIIAGGLARHGVSLVVAPNPTGTLNGTVLAREEWVVSLAGPKATQDRFSFIDTAGNALLAKLLKRDLNRLPEVARLEVVPINNLSDNQVGWAAVILDPR